METGYARLTVYFEDPFWVGLFERGGGGTWEACKVTFGPEPKDHEVYAFLLENHRRLQFSPAIAGQPPAAAAANPKRRQRQIKRQLERPGCARKSGGRSTEDIEPAAQERPPSGRCPGGGLFPS